MSNYFEELGLLDRPYVDFTSKLKGKEVKFRARSLSGQESDELESLQMDEYAKILSKLTEKVDGSMSELERVRKVFESSPIEDVAKQLVAARENEVISRALDISGIDFRTEATKMEAMEESEREAYATVQNEKYEAARAEATAELQAKFVAEPIEKLAKELSQVSINVRAMNLARRTFNDTFLYYALYHPDKDEKIFTSRDAVGKDLTAETIQQLVTAAQEALSTDIPFVSPGDNALDKQPSSPDTSEAVTEAGGKPTPTTPDV
jgi:hypothetical protein